MNCDLHFQWTAGEWIAEISRLLITVYPRPRHVSGLAKLKKWRRVQPGNGHDLRWCEASAVSASILFAAVGGASEALRGGRASCCAIPLADGQDGQAVLV